MPGYIDEARTMIAYNERILQTSASSQRRHRAERMLANLQPVLARLERDESTRLDRIASSTPPASTFDGTLQRWRDRKHDEPDYETVWNGGEGLTTMTDRV